MNRGPVLLECPACGSRLTLFCPVWFIAAAIGIQTVVILILNFMVLTSIPRLAWVGVLIAEWMFGWQYGKHLFGLWRKFWFWRHPTRCTHDRGHPVPALSHV